MRWMLLLLAFGCGREEPDETTDGDAVVADGDDATPDDSGGGTSRGPWTTPPPSVVEQPERLVAFADVHGDYEPGPRGAPSTRCWATTRP